jgi:hypothetical protein
MPVYLRNLKLWFLKFPLVSIIKHLYSIYSKYITPPSMAQEALMGQGLFIIEASRSLQLQLLNPNKLQLAAVIASETTNPNALKLTDRRTE